MVRIPKSVQEIADVIGDEAALYLISQLRKKEYIKGKKRFTHVSLYVPQKLVAGHRLVKILGHELARQLVEAFGGEVLYPALCKDFLFAYKKSQALHLKKSGMPRDIICKILGISERTYYYAAAKGTEENAPVFS